MARLDRQGHDDLAAGRLVRLSDIDIPSAESDYLVCLERQRSRPAIKAFRDWLIEEARGA